MTPGEQPDLGAPTMPVAAAVPPVPVTGPPVPVTGGPVQSLGRATRTMALATTVSRLTGFARTVVLVAAIGLGIVGDAYNTANTLPNIVYELLLGGVLTSVIVPLLVHARVRDADDGLAYTQRLLSLLTVVLLVATALAILGAPLLTYAYGIREDPEQVALANMLARILLVEIVFYGVGAMLTAILNSRQVFGPPAWAPVLNNLVVIATGLVFIGLNDAAVLTTGTISPGLVWLLGIGTTLGIVVQALALLPSLRRSGVRWAWRWDWRHAGLAEAGRLGLWVIGYVAVSQIGYLVIMALANEAGRESGVGSIVYANASLLFQLPYGIIGVALLTALVPRMSAAAAESDTAAVVRDLSLGARLTAVALLPISGLLIVLGPAIATVAFARGQVDVAQARTVGVVLAFSAFGLLPYAVTLLQLRVFYAMKDARTPTLINLVMVAVRVPLCLLVPALLPTEHIVTGLAVANSLSFVVGAVVGELWLRRRLGGLETARVLRTAGLLVLASAAGALLAWAVALGVESLLGSGVLGSAVAVVAGSLGGGVTVLAGCLILPIPEVRELAVVVRRRFAGGSPRPEHDAGSDTFPVRSVSGFGESRSGEASQVDSGGSEGTPEGRWRPAGGVGEPVSGQPVPGQPVTIGGRYQLLSRSGEDEDTGAGRLSTWRARDGLLRRDVVLRIHAPGGAAARGFINRALAAGVLSHPALAMVYDAVDEGRRAYVVSEWVEGTSLAEKLRGGPLVEADARETIRRVAEGVAQAHELGLAVGGLVPERVILTPGGSVTVVAIPAPVASPDADVRALGALLFATMAGFMPAEDNLAELDRQLTNAVSPDLAGVALTALDGQLRTAGEIVSRLLAGRRRRYEDSGLAFITDRYEYDAPVPDAARSDTVSLSDFAWPTISGPAGSRAVGSGPGDAGSAGPGSRHSQPERAGAAAPRRSDSDPARSPLGGDDDYPTDRTRPIADVNQAASASAGAALPANAQRGVTARPASSWLASLPARLGRRPRRPSGSVVDAAGRAAGNVDGDSAGPDGNGTGPDPGGPSGGDVPTDPGADIPADAGPDVAPGAGADAPTAADRDLVDPHPSDPHDTHAPTVAAQTSGSGAIFAGAADEPGPEWMDDDDGAGPERRRRTWLVLAFPVAALLAVAIIGWVIGSAIDNVAETPAGPSVTSSTPPPATTTPAPTTPPVTAGPLAVATATVYDPFGDGAEENNDDSPLAVDGDLSTSWSTLTYRGSPLLGNLKPGVGLVFDLGREVMVSEVTIQTGQPGATVELRAGAQPVGDLETFQLLGQSKLGAQTAIPVDSEQPARYWLVWITELVPDGGDFSASLGEVTFSGVPAP
ncbi:MAG: murein biosynthesis integral membrane protein MurJ [Geodermatophilaceae bacterium]